MKFIGRNSLLPALFTGALLTVLAACSKSNGSSSNTVSGSFSGKAFSASQTLAVDETSQLSMGIEGIQVVSGDSLGFLMFFPDNLTPQTLNWDYTGTSLFVEYLDSKGQFDYDSEEAPSHGTFTLSTFDKSSKRVSGTITGVLYDAAGNDSVVVTNGKFDVAFITQ